MRKPSNPTQLRPRQQQVLRLLWPESRLSRRDLQRRLGIHPNLVGIDIAALLKQRLVCEGDATITGRGRPGIPLRVDSGSRHLIGLAINPDGVQLSKVNLLGQPLGAPTTLKLTDTKTLIRRSARLLREAIDRDTLSIGTSTTGLVDPVAKTLLLSSAIPQATATSLEPLYEAAGKTPMIVQNDMHALAARWLLADGDAAHEDVLIVLLEDGRIGSAMLIAGSPNQGSAIGGNELGHMRFPVDTPKCFCGHTGCLERIFSTENLAMLDAGKRAKLDGGTRAKLDGGSRAKLDGGSRAKLDGGSRAKLDAGSHRTLAQTVSGDGKESPGTHAIFNLLGHGIANAANFVRPHRLIVTGSLITDDAFFNRLRGRIQPLLLSGLSDRLRIERWNLPTLTWSETAAWVALVDLLGVGEKTF